MRGGERLSQWEGTNLVTDPSWGDNGKGRVVDELAQRAHLVVRTNGGPNAGHTVHNEQGEFKLHLIPCGIFNPEAICVLADTVVVNPISLAEEITSLRQKGIEVTSKNLLVSQNAHLIMPWHRKRDNLRELARGGEKIGTTGQGIGPAYGDRSERVGLRVEDLLRENFEQLFDRELLFQEKLARVMAGNEAKKYDRDAIFEDLLKARETIAPLITYVLPVITKYHDSHKRVLGEAGQGALLDLDRGGYPNVTSSHPGLSGFCLATNISPQEVERVIAVTKAYSTRVGEGPLPTELDDEVGEEIREKGGEYGATTGRSRRCGWLDVPATRYGIRTVSANSLALTKLDIFDDFPEIKICVAYKIGNKYCATAPIDNGELMRIAEPIYETLPGWERPTSGCRDYYSLPLKAREFIQRTEELLGKPIELVSVGPNRGETIYR